MPRCLPPSFCILSLTCGNAFCYPSPNMTHKRFSPWPWSVPAAAHCSVFCKLSHGAKCKQVPYTTGEGSLTIFSFYHSGVSFCSQRLLCSISLCLFSLLPQVILFHGAELTALVAGWLHHCQAQHSQHPQGTPLTPEGSKSRYPEKSLIGLALVTCSFLDQSMKCYHRRKFIAETT